MKVKQLQLQNYGRFDNLTMEFAPNGETNGNVTIIVGNNGAGKSQILQALATGFSWFANGIKDESSGLDIDEKLIKNNSNETQITFDVDFGKYNYQNQTDIIEISRWNIVKIRDGKIGEFSNYHKELKEVIKNYRNYFTNNEGLSLPLIVFYSVDRNIVDEINYSIIPNNYLNQISAYSDLFKNYSINFNAFVDWFRYLEDEYLQISNDSLKNISRKDFSEISLSIEQINFMNSQLLALEKQMTFFESQKELLEKMGEKETSFQQELSEISQLRVELIEQKNLLEKIMESNRSNYFRQREVKYGIEQAIELFTDFKNIRIERQGTPKMVVEKDGEKLDVNQLSQGEKSLLALVGDIARRLAMLNPSLDNPLQGEGVVLIDEVDLHLHPKWQQNLIDKLTKTFPNVQFILTTHSPHIVSDNPDVLVYILDDGELRPYNNAYGEDVNTLLNGVFGVSERTPEIAEKFKMIGDYISDKQLDNAKNLIDKLSEILPKNHTELLRTQLTWAKAKLDQSKEV